MIAETANRNEVKAQSFVGQPLYALSCVLIIYACMRAFLWETPFADLPSPATDNRSQLVQSEVSGPGSARLVLQNKQPKFTASLSSGNAVFSARQSASVVQMIDKADNTLPIPIQPVFEPPEGGKSQVVMRLRPYAPAETQPSGDITSAPALTVEPNIPALSGTKKWSFNSWVLYRQETATTTLALAGSGQQPSTYGASQAGAVLRYRLDSGSNHVPSTYMRVTSALGSVREQELVAGLSARPVPTIPVVLAAEARASRLSSGNEIRPALFAYTELPAVSLPYQLRAEAYIQAGYVGGSFATPFADGQLRLDREVATFDLATIRAGAGVWGGVQNGAERLDAGPTVSVDFDIAGAPVRISADYRHRITGTANPQSGAAVTVTTGF